MFFFFFSSRRRHTRLTCDWSSDVCSSDLAPAAPIDRLQVIRGKSPVRVCLRDDMRLVISVDELPDDPASGVDLKDASGHGFTDQKIAIWQIGMLPFDVRIEWSLPAASVYHLDRPRVGIDPHDSAAAEQAAVSIVAMIIEYRYPPVMGKLRVMLPQPGPYLIPFDQLRIRVEHKDQIQVTQRH